MVDQAHSIKKAQSHSTRNRSRIPKLPEELAQSPPGRCDASVGGQQGRERPRYKLGEAELAPKTIVEIVGVLKMSWHRRSIAMVADVPPRVESRVHRPAGSRSQETKETDSEFETTQ